MLQDRFISPPVDTVTQMVRMTVARIKKMTMTLVQPLVSPWITAAEAGDRGDQCDRLYHHCQVYFNISSHLIICNKSDLVTRMNCIPRN